MSLDIFAYRKLRGIAKDCEDRYHHIEKRMEQEKELWASGNHPTFLLEIEEADKRYRFKQSKDCVQCTMMVIIAERFHLFPFRTQKLSSFTLKILGWRRPGKLNQCRHFFKPLSLLRERGFCVIMILLRIICIIRQ